jgi:hypothetical protein
MRYYIDLWPEVPDNRFTRTVAVIGAVAALLGFSALALLAAAFVLAGAYGIVSGVLAAILS